MKSESSVVNDFKFTLKQFQSDTSYVYKLYTGISEDLLPLDPSSRRNALTCLKYANIAKFITHIPLRVINDLHAAVKFKMIMQQLLQARIAGEDQERRLFDSRRNGGGKGKKGRERKSEREMRTLSHAPTKRRRGTRRLMVGGGLTEMRLDVLDAKRFVGSSWNLLTERGSFDHSFPFSSLLLTTKNRFREMPSIRLFIPFSIPFS